MVGLMRRRRARARARGGFTLVEVMVALGILAGGLLALAAAQIFAMRGGHSGRHTTDAAEIAQAQVEVFQRMSWLSPGLAATGGWTNGPAVDRVMATQLAAVVEQTYSVRWRIVNVTPSLKSIDVQVQWDEPNRPGRSYTVTTMRHNESSS
jgi:prepilin-type N-terminal cleavage/methylation domain-containing protein